MNNCAFRPRALWDDTWVRSRPHSAPPTRWKRVLGGALGASFATLVAAFSHVLAGGAVPSVAAIALSLALSVPLCIALAGPALSLWRTTAAVLGSQALFHFLFSGISSSGTITMSPHAGHSGVDIGTTGLHAAAAAGHSASMWLAHAVAAALTVVVLRYTESAVMRLRETTILLLTTLTVIPTAVFAVSEMRTPRVGCTKTIVVRDLTLLFSTLRHRGPPALCAA